MSFLYTYMTRFSSGPLALLEPFTNSALLSLCHDLAKTAKSLSIFLFFSFSFYLGLTTQKEVQESVTSQVSHSHSHMTGSHMIGMGK